MDNPEKPKLLPCPFCGDMPKFDKVETKYTDLGGRYRNVGRETYMIRCEAHICVVKPKTEECHTEGICIEAWNTRCK